MILSVLIFLFSFASFGALNEPITIEKLENFVKTNKVNSVEKFLEKLPTDLKKHYTMVHSSKSLQGGTYQDPRVILYSPNAQMIFSFNGGPHQRGGDTIELFLFNQNKAFEAHEFDFSGTTVEINRNPQKCFGCHSNPIKPNWNNFNSWIDVYGGNNHHLTPRKKDPTDRPNLKEYFELEEFKKNYDKHPRYKHLVDLKERYSLNREIKTENDFYRKPYPQLKAMPNSELSELVSQLNFTRITKSLREHPEYPRFKYSFLSMMSCFYVDFKKSLGTLNINVSHSGFYNINDYSNPLEIGPIFDDYMEAFQNTFTLFIGQLDTNFFFKYIKKEDGSDLYEPINRFKTPGVSGQEFAAIFATQDSDLKEFVLNTYKANSYKPGGVYRSIIDCEALAEKSARVLSE